MPNHVYNRLSVITNNPRSILAMARGKRVAYAPSRYDAVTGNRPDAEVYDFTFNGFVPVPENIRSLPYDPCGYDWQRENWGTKWEAYGPPRTARNDPPTWEFQTAWSPPSEFLHQASGRLAGSVWLLSWYEEDSTFGRESWQAGKLLSRQTCTQRFKWPEDEDDEAAWDRAHGEAEKARRVFYDSHDTWVDNVSKWGS